MRWLFLKGQGQACKSWKLQMHNCDSLSHMTPPKNPKTRWCIPYVHLAVTIEWTTYSCTFTFIYFLIVLIHISRNYIQHCPHVPWKTQTLNNYLAIDLCLLLQCIYLIYLLTLLYWLYLFDISKLIFLYTRKAMYWMNISEIHINKNCMLLFCYLSFGDEIIVLQIWSPGLGGHSIASID